MLKRVTAILMSVLLSIKLAFDMTSVGYLLIVVSKKTSAPVAPVPKLGGSSAARQRQHRTHEKREHVDDERTTTLTQPSADYFIPCLSSIQLSLRFTLLTTPARRNSLLLQLD
jgi:hypothetical protein